MSDRCRPVSRASKALRLLVAALALGLATTVAPPATSAPATSAPGASDRLAAPGRGGDAERREQAEVRSILRQLTLKQKVGQLFVIEVAGRSAFTVSDEAKAVNQRLYGVDTPAEAIAKYRPGGVIYFTARNGDDNIGDPAQVAALSNGLQLAALAPPRRGVPLQISVDQEGGSLVARFGPPATQLPGNMALGAGRSRADARTSARVIGTELAAVGVTQPYAPVADVNVNPFNPVIGIRSIGSDPGLVSDLVTAQVRGFHDAGVSAVAKHFPGHGDTGVDSHYGLPEVTHTRAELDAIDLPPFRAAIAAGVDTIMTAHVVLPALDPGVPATMSRPILTGLLRRELGFRGLVVTDALDMAGATETYPPDVAPVRALLAGADQLLIPPQMDTAYAAVLEAVRSGRITRARLHASVRRILLHKLRHGLFHDPFVDVARAPEVMGDPAHQQTAQEISDRTTTLLANADGLLPLRAGERDVLVTGWGAATTERLATALTARGASTQVLETGLRPTPEVAADAAAAAADADLVVVTTNNAYARDAATGEPTANATAQTALIRDLLATGTPVVVAAVRNPYDVASFPEAPTVLATYGYTTGQVESLARVLFGEVDPAGRLPVSVPAADGSGDLFPFGHGLGY